MILQPEWRGRESTTMDVLANVPSLSYFLPELILTIFTLVVLVVGMFNSEREGFDLPTGLTLVGLAAAFAAHLRLYDAGPHFLFAGMLALDRLAVFFKGFFILSGIVTVLISIYSTELSLPRKSEYFSILLAIVLGMCLVASSTDLLMLYLSVELMSLGSYVLVGFAREGKKTYEAAMKYVLYGGVSTGVMLFGMSLMYGLSGTTALFGPEGIGVKLLMNPLGGNSIVLFTAFLLTMVGVGYKIAAVPFHFWCPDVYEGAPTPITAFLSVASKGTGFALLLRLYYQTFLREGQGGRWTEVPGLDWALVLGCLSAVTMTLGNLGAIPQNNIKRLLAYSGIAHAGYVLMGAAVATTSGIEAMLFYLLMYLFTNLAVFTIVIVLIDRAGIVEIEDYQGLWRRNLSLSAAMMICLLSLIGIPPTVGFLGKYYLFMAVIHTAARQPWFWWLLVIAALNTVISCYYYFRIVKAMFLTESERTEPIVSHPLYSGLAWVLTAAVVLLFVIPGSVYEYAASCARVLR